MMSVSRQAVIALSLVCGCALPTGGLSPDFDSGLASIDAAADGGARDGNALDTGARDSSVVDTGTADTGTADTGTADTGTADTGTADGGPVDSGPVDSGPSCDGGSDQCEGDTRVVCEAGAERRQDCTALSGYCDDSSGAPACVDWVCTPGASSCSSPTEETRCDARGTAEIVSACDRGCDSATSACRPETPCALTVEGTAALGHQSIDTCTGGDDMTPVTGCTGVDISGGDRILRLDVPVANTYRIDFNDVARVASLDALLYLRTACDDRASEIACDDDGGDSQNSRIELDLEPGEYFLILDSYRDTGEDEPGHCGVGDVNISIR